MPVWDWLFGILIPPGPVAFNLQSSHAFLQVDGRDLTVLTSGFNAITLIVAFMIFAAARRDGAFDRRLVLAGLPRPVAVAAKAAAIVVVAALVSLYAALVLEAFWRPVAFGAVWLGYLLDALTYGALGLLLGVLVSSELAGFFLIIMVSLIDTTLQAPIENPLANKDFLAGFPSYGPMQVAVSGGFGHGVPGGGIVLALLWFVGFLVAGLADLLVAHACLERARAAPGPGQYAICGGRERGGGLARGPPVPQPPVGDSRGGPGDPPRRDGEGSQAHEARRPRGDGARGRPSARRGARGRHATGRGAERSTTRAERVSNRRPDAERLAGLGLSRSVR